MMDIRTYPRGKVIFRQGDAGDCMYSVQFGSVGIFLDYGGPNEKKLTDLMADEFFGEMGLLDHAPRSATAVSLSDETVIEVITEADFYDYFKKNPNKVLLLMQQMCSRLRRTTRDYVRACQTVRETVDAEKSGTAQSGSLMERIERLCELYSNFSSMPHT